MDRAFVLRHFNALKPSRKTLYDILLKETGFLDTSMKALHRDRPASQMWQHQRSDHFVVRGDFTFGDTVGGKKYLVRMCDHCLRYCPYSCFLLLPLLLLPAHADAPAPAPAPASCS